MDSTNANRLLESYYQGETTLQQERDLRAFLAQYQGDEPQLLQAKQMFEILSQTKNEVLNLEMEQITDRERGSISRWLQWSGAIAAAIMVPIVLTMWLKTTPHPVVYAYVDGKPVTNKEQALLDTQKALLALSDNMAKGTEPLKQIQIINKPVELLTFKK